MTNPPHLAIRVVYEDLPDLIEIETRVEAGAWSGVGRAYTQPSLLRESAINLGQWTYPPSKEFIFEAGADTGIGWLKLRWYPADMAMHLACHVQLATYHLSHKWESGVWRLSVEMFTEPGLLEQFARHLAGVAETLEGEAVLEGSFFA